MNKIKALIGSVIIAGAAALPLSSAQAWWGPWGGYGPWDGSGFGDFNMSFRGSGYGYGRPYYGYGYPGYWGGYPYGYGYAPYGGTPYGYPYGYPVAPAAPQAESK